MEKQALTSPDKVCIGSGPYICKAVNLPSFCFFQLSCSLQVMHSACKSDQCTVRAWLIMYDTPPPYST